MPHLRALGIVGSLRPDSHNAALLRAAQGVCPRGLVIEAYEGLGDLPLYDESSDTEPVPPAVADLRSRVRAAHGLLIVTPEHNASIPAALKNAIDWASRPLEASPLAGTPVAIAGASPGGIGSARAQVALRQILVSIGADVLAKPDVMVARVHEHRAPDGTLRNRITEALLRDLLHALVQRIEVTRAPA